jgi:hypothetical protein
MHKREAYAAVAANISIRLAFVAIARLAENANVKAHTTPSRADVLVTNDRTIIETIGVSEDATVPRMYMTPNM